MYLRFTLLFSAYLCCQITVSQEIERNTSRDSFDIYYAKVREHIFNDLPKAMQNLKKAKKFAKITEAIHDDAKVAIGFGSAYYIKGAYVEAFQSYLEALELYRKEDNALGIAKALNGIGLIQQGIDRNAEAINFFEQAIEKFKEAKKINDAYISFLNIAISQIEVGDYVEAKENLQIGLDLATRKADTRGIHLALNKLGEVNFAEGRYIEAMNYYRQVLQDTSEPNAWEKSFAHAGLAKVFLNQEKLDLAEEHALQSISFAENTESTWDLERNTKIISDVYAAKDLDEKAYHYLKLNRTYRDSLYNKKKLREINFLQLKSQEEENLRLKAENALAEEKLFINKIGIFILITVSLFLILLVFLYRRNSTQKERFNQKLAAKSNTISEQNNIITEKNKKLDEINKSKDRLFSILSHDLKSPIGSIQQLLELIKIGEFSELEKDELLDDMYHQISGTSAMLQNLLQWAKSQLEGEQVKIENIALPQEVEKVVKAHYLVAKNKNIKIVHEVVKLSEIKLDNGMLSIILQNLLSNAIKFTAEGGIIKISYVEEPDWIHFKILDGGEPISETKIEEIKESDASILSQLGTDMETGTGIGLLLVKQFLKANGAKLEIIGHQNIGSEFVVSLKR